MRDQDTHSYSYCSVTHGLNLVLIENYTVLPTGGGVRGQDTQFKVIQY